jgi:Skp family chaperone for outer membrane proteins
MNKQPHVTRRETMQKLTALGALVLAGLLAFTGNIGMGKRVYAQSDPQKLTDQQYEELKQKRLQQYQELEQEDKDRANTAKRRQDAEKRRQDAEKRQRDAERKMQELQK